MKEITSFFKPLPSTKRASALVDVFDGMAKKPRVFQSTESDEDKVNVVDHQSSPISSDPTHNKEVDFAHLSDAVPSCWKPLVADEFSKNYFLGLQKFLVQEEVAAQRIYPPKQLIFNALARCPFEKTRVVIIGQDPYHNPGEAMGLSFSVPRGVRVPSSLRNIFKELSTDLGPKVFTMPSHGDLTSWAGQGVLLLNTTLTVRHNEPNSHHGKGWQQFTDALIHKLTQKRQGIVFLLWGKHAQEKEKLIDGRHHHVLKAAHPSGLSAARGFFGCKHFSKTNSILSKHGLGRAIAVDGTVRARLVGSQS